MQPAKPVEVSNGGLSQGVLEDFAPRLLRTGFVEAGEIQMSGVQV